MLSQIIKSFIFILTTIGFGNELITKNFHYLSIKSTNHHNHICKKNYNSHCIENDSIEKTLLRLLNEANRLFSKQDHLASLELFNSYITLATKTLNEKTIWKILRTAYSRSGYLASELNLFNNSISYITKSLALTIKYDPKNRNELFSNFFSIGLSYYKLHDFESSLDNYFSAEMQLDSKPNSDQSRKAILYNNIGLCYLKQGLVKKANSYLDISLSLKTLAGDIDELARTYNNIALAYQSNKLFNISLENFQKSLDLYSSVQNKEKIAFVLNNIGNMYLATNDLDSTLIYYQKSLSIRLDEINTSIEGLIVSYNNVSYINSQLNSIDSALEMNQIAISLIKEQIKSGGRIPIQYFTEYLTAIADRIALNTKLFQLDNNSNHLSESYDLFNETIIHIIDHLTNYNSIGTSNTFLNDNKKLFDTSINSAYILDSITNPTILRTIIISEVYKSLSQFNLLNELRTLDGISLINPSFRNTVASSNRDESRIAIDESNPQVISEDFIDTTVNSTLKLIELKNIRIGIIRDNLVQYYLDIDKFLLSNFHGLEKKLIINYYSSDNEIFIHLINQSKSECWKILLDPNFSTTILELLKALKSLDNTKANLNNVTLSKILLGPILDHLTPFENLIIIPDELLSEIPFEVLTISRDVGDKLEYLVTKKSLSYRFAILSRNYLHKPKINVFKNDYLGISPSNISLENSDNVDESAKEINDTQNLFLKLNLTTLSFIGPEATVSNLLIHSFNSKIIHFSTHSNISKENYNLSLLELFPDETQSLFSLPFISSIPICCDLLILNACETNKNLLENSYGFVSFIKYLSNYSINNYIGTIWKILDEPSHLFSLIFFENILSGFDYATALTNTKRHFIKSIEYSNPFFWSPYVLYERE